MKSDIEIAQAAKIKPIVEIADILSIPRDDLELYGKFKAKLPLHHIDEEKIRKAKLILVTAITPTPAGAGFIVPIAGTIMRMPGLPNIPAAEKIDIDSNGNITGLF